MVTLPPVQGIGPARELPITEAILELIRMGIYPTNAAKTCGISESTYANWLARAQEWAEADPEEYPDDQADVVAAYVDFADAAEAAEAQGLAWHERNVYLSAMSGREQGGRLSLEFLARRMPKVYGRRDRLDVTHGGREPAPVDTPTLAEAQASFRAVGAGDLDASTILPALPSGDGD